MLRLKKLVEQQDMQQQYGTVWPSHKAVVMVQAPLASHKATAVCFRKQYNLMGEKGPYLASNKLFHSIS